MKQTFNNKIRKKPTLHYCSLAGLYYLLLMGTSYHALHSTESHQRTSQLYEQTMKLNETDNNKNTLKELHNNFINRKKAALTPKNSAQHFNNQAQTTPKETTGEFKNGAIMFLGMNIFLFITLFHKGNSTNHNGSMNEPKTKTRTK